MIGLWPVWRYVRTSDNESSSWGFGAAQKKIGTLATQTSRLYGISGRRMMGFRTVMGTTLPLG